MELGIIKSVEGIKLHLHTDFASRKAMIGTMNNPSDILTKFMPQTTLTKPFSKVGIAKVALDEVRIQHFKVKLKVNALSSSPTTEIDVKTPKSRKRFKDDSVCQVKRQQRDQEVRKCCKCDATQLQRKYIQRLSAYGTLQSQRLDCKRCSQQSLVLSL
eukprot:4879616-Amphidinium_carterae.1